jgi:hypothetical protein
MYTLLILKEASRKVAVRFTGFPKKWFFFDMEVVHLGVVKYVITRIKNDKHLTY